MKILLTGASGFLGNVIKGALSGHEITTLGRNDAHIKCNLALTEPTLPAVDLVIHAAAKAHSVPKTDQEVQEFYDVNVNGTKNLLRALSNCYPLPNSFVLISSISVYGLKSGTRINEEFPLLADDPYGRSKVLAEELVREWCDQNGVICTIMRLPLIAGANPPGNLSSMINGIKKGYYFNVAGGTAKKSIVLAEDVAQIIPKAAGIGGIYNLTDGFHPSFHELAALIAGQLNKSVPGNIPAWLAALAAKAGDVLGKKAPLNTNKLKKITRDLTFDDSKAFQVLGWKPTSVLKGFKIK